MVDHMHLLKAVLRTTFPDFGTLAATAPQPCEVHPVVRLRMESVCAALVRPARTARKLRSVAVGSGVFAQRRTAALAALRTRPSLR